MGKKVEKKKGRFHKLNLKKEKLESDLYELIDKFTEETGVCAFPEMKEDKLKIWLMIDMDNNREWLDQ